MTLLFAEPSRHYHWTFKQMISDMKETDARLLAARVSPATCFEIEGEKPMAAKDILGKPDRAAILVSTACMKVFQGIKDYRPIARNLDFLAYGREVQRRAPAISKAVIRIVGDRKAGDVVETAETD
jgi:hypothetical protein